jgi:hypothetical protein
MRQALGRRLEGLRVSTSVGSGSLLIIQQYNTLQRAAMGLWGYAMHAPRLCGAIREQIRLYL